MNWTIIILVGILLLALIIFLVRRNARDEKEFEKQQNNDFHMGNEGQHDTDVEEKME